LLRCRPPQAGPKGNTATADVQFLTAVTGKGEVCKSALWPGLLCCTLLPPQHFCNLGVTQQTTPVSLQAAQKCPGSHPRNKLVHEKQELETHCLYKPNTVPLSTTATSFNPSLGSYEVRRET